MLRTLLIGLFVGNLVVYGQLAVTLSHFSEAATLKAIHKAEPKPVKPVTVIRKDGPDYIPQPEPLPESQYAWTAKPVWI